MPNVMLVSDGWFHPPQGGRAALRDLIRNLPDISCDEVSTLSEALSRPLSSYAAMVLYYHHPSQTLTEGELNQFRNYCEHGGGVVAIHSATASYKSQPEYFAVLGGRFTGHGPVSAIEISPVGNDRIFAGIGAFQITDELYIHDLASDLEVHFESSHEGKKVPVVWTRRLGEGRVCYLCPGHRSASMRDENVRRIVERGLRWACGLA